MLTLLPTPQANLGRNGGSQDPDKRRQGGHSVSLQDVPEFLPTPSASDGTGGPGTSPNRQGGANLRTAVTLLATPKASDATKGGPNQCNGKGEYDALPGQVHVDRFGKYRAAVDRWKNTYGHEPPPPTLPDGRGGNHRLNPLFARWMMGLEHVRLEGLPRKQQLMAIGNSVFPYGAAYAYKNLLARKDER